MAANSSRPGPGAHASGVTSDPSTVPWESIANGLWAFSVAFFLAAACFQFLRWRFDQKLKWQGQSPLLRMEPAILLASFFVGLATVVLGLAWYALSRFDWATNLDVFLKLGGFVVALGYFIYRVMGGAFFATTSVMVTAERDPLLSGRVLVTVSIERGTQWTADIASVAHLSHESEQMWPQPPSKMDWKAVPMPMRQDGSLRLAPGEKTATSFYLTPVTFSAFYLTVRVVSFAQLWPVPSESFARVCVGTYVPVTASR